MIKKILEFFKNLLVRPAHFDSNITPPMNNDSLHLDQQSIDIDTKNSRQWKYIVIHHSETSDGLPKEWEEIKKYHMSWRYQDNSISEEEATKLTAQGKNVIAPWSDIGYHFGISSDLTSKKFQYLKGRSLSTIGAHAKGFNETGIGICCLGSFNKLVPSAELYSAVKVLVKKLQQIYNIPDSSVIGHRETYALLNVPQEKNCPGKFWDLDSFRTSLKK